MRRSVSKIPYRPSAAPSSIAVAFSTSSGGGGRGRGDPNPFNFTVPTPSNDDSENPYPPPPLAHGRGRGRGSPVSSSPVLPSFNSFLNNDSSSAAPGRGRVSSSPVLPSFNSFLNNDSSSAAPGRGRGVGFTPPNFSSPPPTGNESKFDVQTPRSDVKKPFLFGEAQSDLAESEAPTPREKAFSAGILGVLPGAGRGMPTKPPTQEPSPHPGGRQRGQSPNKDTAIRVQLSQDEKVRRAREILSKGDKSEGARAESGGRGRGVARGSRRGGYGGRDTEDYNRYEERDDQPTGQSFPDPADMEKLANRLGPENMSKLREVLEDMAEEVLPDPRDEALHNNFDYQLRLECEPEFFVEDFGKNPDIEEKAPIPLRDALAKMKPFLMLYHGIQSHEEWEEAMEETIKNESVMKEVVDYYGGPDRATAKQQCGELERVAKTLPASTPASVKRFTDRAVLSLQNNPGWGFDKKCFFMDKLVMEVEQHYK